jgi:hypothetical protein
VELVLFGSAGTTDTALPTPVLERELRAHKDNSINHHTGHSDVVVIKQRRSYIELLAVWRIVQDFATRRENLERRKAFLSLPHG